MLCRPQCLEPGASEAFWEGTSIKLSHDENRCKRVPSQRGQKGGFNEPSITLTPAPKEGLLRAWFWSLDSASVRMTHPLIPLSAYPGSYLFFFIPGMELNCLKDDVSSPARALLEDEF